LEARKRLNQRIGVSRRQRKKEKKSKKEKREKEKE